MTAEPQPVANIGNISELTGNAKVLRDEEIGAELKLGIQSLDDVRTAAGRVGIKFLDGSVVRLTEHSKLVIDSFIFDPDPSKSKMALKFASGTARFITGGLGKINKENIFLSTPTAQISIRGTSFSCTTNELGASLIVLLPDEFGLSSGEILVTTAMGSVLLNKPFEATSVSVYESAPTKPVVLDLTLDLIDNMLIVSPPKEIVEIQEEEQTQQVNLLDFNDLDVDYLEEDVLDNEADLEFTELDINYLDVNFLEDLLDIMQELDIIKQEDALSVDATQVSITGTKVGQDLETQITTIIQGQSVKLIRNVGHYAELNIDGSGEYTVIFIQEGVSKTITVNGGGSSVIKITQGS
tara:strand:- start:2997 stop:4055 length:1059 start_codon:yes stop_codon:yes gene_type:complete